MANRLDNRTVLVTGANGGLGEQFVHQALALGAVRVYAAARSPRSWDDNRIVPLVLDLNDPATISAAALTASDVDLLVNNAAIAPADDNSVVNAEDEVIRRVFETNFFGTLRVTSAFAPVLASNGGGAILTVLSLAVWSPVPTAYAASKAAMLSATNGLRAELAPQGTTVTGLIVGMIDTPMSTRWDVPKVSPASVVAQAYEGAIAGVQEVLADDNSRFVKSLLGAPGEELDAAIAEAMKGFEA